MMKPLKLIAAATVIAISLPAFAEDEPGMMGEKKAQPATHMMGKHGHHMMGKREKMWTHIKTQNAELDKLAAAMNSAEGSEKVDAIAAVVNKLVEIHKEMSNKMMRMHKRHMGSPCPHMEGMMCGKMMEEEKGTEQEEEHQEEE
jgi:hypothetical protein